MVSAYMSLTESLLVVMDHLQTLCFMCLGPGRADKGHTWIRLEPPQVTSDNCKEATTKKLGRAKSIRKN